MAKSAKEIGQHIISTTADILASSDFISRSIGMTNSYEDIMFVVQALGREPVSLLGKDYLYIFDHVRRNYNMGSNVMDYNSNDCPKFTFYKDKPTVRFANPYDDPKNLKDRWFPNVDFESTSQRNILYSYAESDNVYTNNKSIGATYNNDDANQGVNFGGIASFSNTLGTCDMIKKTNDNFNHGKYDTLIARFHTNSESSKSKDDITQTAISTQFGMSHGRNLLKYDTTDENNGYNNPYCRVWTYHHQYNQLARAIRPFGDAETQEELESLEQSGDTVGFRTVESKDYGFKGGSVRLDKYGVLNRNGMVNIAPTAKIKDYFEHKENDEKAVSTKRCMFSIENLAWRNENIKHDEYDQFGLSPEQKGPLGGRIMWFPPYDLTFNESSRANWNSNQFIGRGENVYTYVNTERTGSISFTLLIDHPSILDYWTGHQRNGMTNQGVPIDKGNNGGVDNQDNQENTLLRFFAGCEVLSAKPQEFRKRDYKPNKQSDVKPKAKKTPPDTEVHKPTSTKKIYCFAFFPNNYSGVNDYPIKSGAKVNAIHYLLNGIGTQRVFNETKKVGEDFSVDMDRNVYLQSDRGYHGYGGYEMRENKGISIAENVLVSKEAIDKTYEGATQTVQFLTDENGGKISVKIGSNPNYVPLTKYSWDKAKTQSEAINKDGSINESWYDYRYYYRVDSNTLSQNLISKKSYIDGKSFKYNSNGIYKIGKTLESEFEKNFDEEDAQIVSLTDLYVALEGDKGGIFDDLKNVGKIGYIKDVIEKKTITKVTIYGNASSQGWNPSKKVNEERNDSLALNRGLTLKKWLIANKFPTAENAETTVNPSVQKGGNKTDVDDNITKLWRSAYIVIEYDDSIVENAAVAEDAKTDASGNVTTTRTSIDDKNESKSIISKVASTPSTWQEAYENPSTSGAVVEYWEKDGEEKGVNYFDDMSWDYNPDFHNSINANRKINGVRKGIVERYDNEGEFFELLEKKDPFLHHLISEKIRYFDPAFHSISPEGFSARLTFLHQCTRQGSTVGGSDNMPGTAYNLAFGRPPVCVLRLGDFYNTKIIINDVNIQYENAQWDLNPEGAGVIPMFAKITISFVFLGGSDLSGPISRLQNAVSFNYYANTSVYDNRAEMVEYDPDGSGHEVKFKPFVYPDYEKLNAKQKRQKVIEVGDIGIADSNNYDTNQQTGWEGTVYYKANK